MAPTPSVDSTDHASQVNVNTASGGGSTNHEPTAAATLESRELRDEQERQHQEQPHKHTAPVEPIFPQLNNTTEADGTPLVIDQSGTAQNDDDDEDEPAVATPFVRTSSPDGVSKTRPASVEEEEDDDDTDDNPGGHMDDSEIRKRKLPKMHKYSLYETASKYYIVGADVTEKRYRILKVDRTADEQDLSVTDDKIVYTQKEMNQLLDTIDDGNKATGGIKLRCTTWGLLGFIKFTSHYYMLLITKKSTVAMLGGHYIYQIDGTELIPLTPAKFKLDQRNQEESRHLQILGNLDLTRSFYYSYSYDITRTLQHNIARERAALLQGKERALDADFNSMFVWNSHLLGPAEAALSSPFDWCRPIIHGYIDQAAISIYGRTAYVAVIARRSRHFAGARFLKRGANDLGYVANDVETEQIVSEVNTTSFHSPGTKLYASPQYTSYVQHRGSIPLHWSQDSTGVTPKPPIEINLIDPFYTSAALHFDNLFERYGAPVYALNLVKARERTPRESKLLEEYTKAIDYLNQFLPEDKHIIHRAWDMSRAAKSRDQDVIGILERIAEQVVTTTGFFHNGDTAITPASSSDPGAPRVQNGVARTNCIDCLDRTNAAQFVIGKRALGHQLHALGILEDTVVDYDTDAVNLLTHMYHDHGDTIAVQYGGSQLVNTMETYRKINQWTSHSRDMIESFKRYYNNSFLDGQRQEAYNLFLGNYVFVKGQPMLWDLATDYYLHHTDPRAWLGNQRHNYTRWYTPQYLEPRTVPPCVSPSSDTAAVKPVSYYDDYWLEYYRPSTLSSFLKMFPFKMNSTIKFIPFKSTQEGRYDLSPFRVRTEGDQDAPDKRRRASGKKNVTVMTPEDQEHHGQHYDPYTSLGSATSASMTHAAANGGANGRPTSTKGFRGWLQNTQDPKESNVLGQFANGIHLQGIMKESTSSLTGSAAEADPKSGKPTSLEKSRAAQWTFAKMVHESLNPSVNIQETEDYARYISHPQTLPLVISADPVPSDVDAEYEEYIHGNWQTQGLSAPHGSGGSYYTSSMYGRDSVTAQTTMFSESIGDVEKEQERDEMYMLFEELLKVGDNPLTVTEEDAQKKRYKAYRKWLRGKSLFKQQPVD
ncbi:polyphosphoinositide phosphatase [Pyricularia oryzae 70-15]|uniref:Polyphosphoinositide phosphatase n=3 Tax=Pyricularia oryzae TaxID=318829 RepID=G4MSQ4_PYRO7|nr:polyphosphoinositide phosphatase [Pyricularia oryzae 70-15]EHA55475.1 polyphosphoinositide phosphatase [Pyricularia oryzae 70-15]ELQ35436.1 polyphosphoinositide phosphatase [Pyricularia oryzae Y34]KAI7922922.1 polyphosphoinositide phosphatase [Pyricularia oryzae]KAI7925491.1 polyphosphoinositide phosphatase [Pyricularia oryzae]